MRTRQTLTLASALMGAAMLLAMAASRVWVATLTSSSTVTPVFFGFATVAGVNGNDARAVHPAIELFPNDPSPFSHLDDACLDQLPDSLDRSGDNPGCITAEGAFDKNQLVQALLNLARNALQAVGDRGRITLRTRVASNASIGLDRHRLAVRVEVEDNGPGVPPAARAPLLERFRRGGGSPAQGSGLGLAIVQDIAALHGGEVALLDAAGGGLRVRVALPRRPRAAALQPPAPGSACASSSSM